MMVATEKRRKAAQLLLNFYKGRITNDQMDDAWPRDASDPALMKVFWAKWGLYSDLREEHIRPKLRRSYPVAKVIHRCVVFLNSRLEYEWYGWPYPGTWADRLVRQFSRKRRELYRAGNESVWPFYRAEDYKRAWKQMRNLSG
ncbi:MAG: hypothetical protein ACR2IF_06725 [Terriglobales bacterium]